MAQAEPKINCNKIKVSSFSAELPEALNPDQRIYVTIEALNYEVALRDNQDGSADRVFKVKSCGEVIVKQDGIKSPLVCKGKKTQSQILRQEFWVLNPDDDFYQTYMQKIIMNLPAVVDYLKNL